MEKDSKRKRRRKGGYEVHKVEIRSLARWAFFIYLRTGADGNYKRKIGNHSFEAMSDFLYDLKIDSIIESASFIYFDIRGEKKTFELRQ